MVEQTIKEAGYKLTKPRISVLNVLKKDHKPLGAKDIHKKLKNKIDLVSVYRALKLFESLNIVFTERFNNQESYYLDEKQHHHIVCRKCGTTKCIPCDHIFKKIKNFTNISHNLSISGICKNCS